MRAIQISDYGSILNLHLQTDVPKPTTIEIPKDHLLIETETVALAPGDCRVLSGKTKELQGPPSFPYIPGGDCCGTIVDMGSTNTKDNDTTFKIGDRVAARFVDGPRGALGEYAMVSTKMCDVVPTNVDSTDAAALASSATCALQLSKRIRSTDKRILVLGAGGGVGSHLIQFLKLNPTVEYVAGVSQNPKRLLTEPLNCDYAVDYTTTDPFTDVPEWKENPFDVVIDLASGSWPKLMELSSQSTKKNETKSMIVKSASEGGRFLTQTADEANYELHGIWAALKLFLFTPLARAVGSRLWKRKILPAYSFTMNLDADRNIMTEVLKLASEGKLKSCVDDRGPFAFTTDGVREAFRLQESRHVNGKVVIRLQKTE